MKMVQASQISTSCTATTCFYYILTDCSFVYPILSNNQSVLSQKCIFLADSLQMVLEYQSKQHSSVGKSVMIVQSEISLNCLNRSPSTAHKTGHSMEKEEEMLVSEYRIGMNRVYKLQSIEIISQLKPLLIILFDLAVC